MPSVVSARSESVSQHSAIIGWGWRRVSLKYLDQNVSLLNSLKYLWCQPPKRTKTFICKIKIIFSPLTKLVSYATFDLKFWSTEPVLLCPKVGRLCEILWYTVQHCAQVWLNKSVTYRFVYFSDFLPTTVGQSC